MSWDDAKQYVAWLSRLSGKPYRLLTDAEWEYAARAGTTTDYPWGDEVGEGNANCVECGSRWAVCLRQSDHLYDVHGNVLQWTEDCYCDSYRGTPSDRSAWTAERNEPFRVVRGGSFIADPYFLRSAHRHWFIGAIATFIVGFRAARTLAP